MNGTPGTSQPTQGVHNAWIGAKGPGSLDLRSETPANSLSVSGESAALTCCRRRHDHAYPVNAGCHPILHPL